MSPSSTPRAADAPIHIAVILGGLPTPDTSGSGIIHWALLRQLVQAGYQVTCCLLLNQANPHLALQDDQSINQLQALGLTVKVFWLDQKRATSRWRQRLLPQVADLYPTQDLTAALQAFLDQQQPDVIYTYEVANLVPLLTYRAVPRLAALVDLDHLPARLRLQTQPWHWRQAPMLLLTYWHTWLKRRWMVRWLQEADAVVNYAAHHAAWLQAHGVPQAQYCPPPVPDLRSHITAKVTRGHQPPRILMVGHLLGTATQLGLRLTLQDILPRLDQALGPQGYQLRIVGAFAEQLPDSLLQQLQHPAIQPLGYLEEIAPEFLSCDVLLVPTPVELGTRIRILVGWCYGCCVVTHSANAKGISALIPGQNALVGASGAQLAAALLQALQSPELRQQLAQAGRSTYESVFQPQVAAQPLLARLDQLARQHQPT